MYVSTTFLVAQEGTGDSFEETNSQERRSTLFEHGRRWKSVDEDKPLAPVTRQSNHL